MCVSDLLQSAEYAEMEISEEDCEGASEDDDGREEAGQTSEEDCDGGTDDGDGKQEARGGQQVHQELLERRRMRKDWRRLQKKHRKEWQELQKIHDQTDTERPEVLAASGEATEHLWQALQKERDDLEGRQQDEIVDLLRRQGFPSESGSGDGSASDDEHVLDFSGPTLVVHVVERRNSRLGRPCLVQRQSPFPVG